MPSAFSASIDMTLWFSFYFIDVRDYINHFWNVEVTLHSWDKTHKVIGNADVLPPMQPGDILIHGHTHLPVAEAMGDKFLLNPGSTSLPKGGNPCSYGMLDGDVFTIYDFEGQKLKEIRL